MPGSKQKSSAANGNQLQMRGTNDAAVVYGSKQNPAPVWSLEPKRIKEKREREALGGSGSGGAANGGAAQPGKSVLPFNLSNQQ